MRFQRWLLALLCVVPAAVFAQLRTIPGDAKAGDLRHVYDMLVAIDGKQQRLSPGAQIRDRDNRIVLPGEVPPGSKVKYLLDADGQVHRVWILTADEAATIKPAGK